MFHALHGGYFENRIGKKSLIIGYEKISINTSALKKPNLITKLSKI